MENNRGEKKIKVLFVVPTPPPYTGLEVMSQFFLESNLKNEFKIILLRGNLNKYNKSRGKVRLGSFYRFILLCARLLFIILKDNPQIVYTVLSENITGFFRSFAVVFISKFCGRKIIAHLYGSNFIHFYKGSNLVIKNMIKCAMKCIDKTIVLGSALRAQFDGIYDPTKIRVVYNAVPEEKFVSHEKMFNKESKKIQVLFIGLLSHAKGFNDVIKSIPLVLEKFPAVKFVFVGERIKVERHILHDSFGERIIFEDIEDFVKSLKEKYPDNVHFRGIINDEQKEKLFVESDIFVLPSYSEGFPIAILEAMGFGLPVITTPVGVMPELLKDGINCFFVPINDSKILAERLKYLIDNPSVRLQMGQNNYSYIKDRLNINKSAEMMANIFKEVV